MTTIEAGAKVGVSRCSKVYGRESKNMASGWRRTMERITHILFNSTVQSERKVHFVCI